MWQDADSDGRVDAGELQSLAAHSIASISLTSDGVAYSAAAGDVQVAGTGSFTRTDGSTGVLADAVFATGGKVSDEARMVAASGSNAALLAAAAVAVAGFGFEAAHHAAVDWTPVEGHLPSAAMLPIAASLADFHSPAMSLGTFDHGLQFSSSMPAVDLHRAAPIMAEANHSLIGSERVEAVAVASLPHGGTDALAHLGPVAAPPMVALPSAEMLAGMAGGASPSLNGHGLLADIIQDGGAQSVDALLHAALPHGGPGWTLSSPTCRVALSSRSDRPASTRSCSTI